MKASIRHKLQHLSERLQELDALLASPDVIRDNNQFRKLSIEYADINPVVINYQAFLQAEEDLAAAEEMKKDPDLEMREMAQEEWQAATAEMEHLSTELQLLLLPKDPDDECNIFLEIRAGTGGDEAAIFAGNLFRMYARYAEKKKWQLEVLSESLGEHGGYKEIISKISGTGVYAHFKFESGGHRVQRVPETETQGRIHTSACTIAVMPEIEGVEEIELNPSDLKVDTFRASGAGGQHVNKTDSAIRITHLPTNTVVECQDERSQHKNRARAMSLLQARLLTAERDKQQAEQAATRRSLVGSGDRSERIRTYNYPQGRVSDHRINLTLYKLEEIMGDQLGLIIDPLIREYQAEMLAQLQENP